MMDNYAADKHPKVTAWLAAHPRIQVHFTPTHASWMNLVEAWFSVAERQAIHRGTYTSVKDLNAKSAPSSTAGTTAPTPVTWTKSADQILTLSVASARPRSVHHARSGSHPRSPLALRAAHGVDSDAEPGSAVRGR